MDDVVKTVRAPCMSPHRPLEPLREHLSRTGPRIAEKPPRSQDQFRAPAAEGEVAQSAHVAAMNAASHSAAKRARTRSTRRPHRHDDALGPDPDILDDEA